VRCSGRHESRCLARRLENVCPFDQHFHSQRQRQRLPTRVVLVASTVDDCLFEVAKPLIDLALLTSELPRVDVGIRPVAHCVYRKPHHASSSSKALASFKSSVSKPSLNQP
jgi:hypothetical protein